MSAQGSLHRLVVRGNRVVSRRAILTGLPFGRHQQDTVAVGPDGRVYLGSGSTCDACTEKDRRSGAILSLEPDGTDVRVEARGLRNPYGLAFRPGTTRLYVSDNGRDDLGDTEPAETIVLFRRGADYGWPRCWSSWQQRRLAGRCAGVTLPVAYLEPHSSANSLAFWRGGLVVAEWGQYLNEQWGRKLVRVDVGSGQTTTLATGFEHPLGLAVEPTAGGLLVGDWGRGDGLPHHEALSRGGEPACDPALVRGRAQQLAFAWVRHEAGLDEHHGNVGPVEPHQVAALDHAEVSRPCRPDELALDELAGTPAVRVHVVGPAAATRRDERRGAAARRDRVDPSAWIRIINAAPRALQKAARSRLPPR